MAQTPLLTLADIRLSFGGKPLFEGVNLTISRGERAALVGRNGAGKSTLMKIVAGRIESDSGKLWMQPGTKIVFAEQEPDLSGFATYTDYIIASGVERHDAEAALMAFAADPDILLLDEPTNHLDVEMIEALEKRLRSFRGAILLVSHDRAFLESVSTNTLWLRQNIVLKSPRGYAHFGDWAAEIEAAEEKQIAKMKTQLRAEARWLSVGVSGRRKRNQGRLGRLKDLRKEHARRRSALGEARNTVDLTSEVDQSKSGKFQNLSTRKTGFFRLQMNFQSAFCAVIVSELLVQMVQAKPRLSSCCSERSLLIAETSSARKTWKPFSWTKRARRSHQKTQFGKRSPLWAVTRLWFRESSATLPPMRGIFCSSLNKSASLSARFRAESATG